MEANPNICIISWSANGLKICESLDEIKVQKNRSSFFTKYLKSCDTPDMFPTFDAIFNSPSPPLLVVIGFTDEAESYTYFHSEFLPSYMSTRGYSFISRDKLQLEGVCRMSIYARQTIAQVVVVGDKINKGFFREPTVFPTSMNIESSGVLASYVDVPGLGVLAFLLIKIEEDYENLSMSWDKEDPMIRKNHLLRADTIFNSIYRKFVLDVTNVDRVFIFGKLNYRMSMFDSDNLLDINAIARNIEKGAINVNEYYKNLDELKKEMDAKNIYFMNEGIKNEGPKFLPTCDRKLGRRQLCKEECFDLGLRKDRVPSWCLRILYNEFDPDRQTECVKYDRFEVGRTITKSLDAGVFGIYELK